MDDERNKAIVLRNAATFAYTGLAEIGPERRTDYWIVDVLSDSPNLQAVFDNLVSQSNAVFDSVARSNPTVDRRHAIVGAGWGRRKPDPNEPLSPYIRTVSNALQSNGSWNAQPSRQFTRSVQWLVPGAPFLATAAGAQLKSSEYRRLDRTLRRGLNSGMGPDGLAQILVGEIRAVASRLELEQSLGGCATVGKSVLVVSIPKTAAQRGGAQMGMSVNGMLDRETVCSLYYPANADAPLIYGPHFISSGIQFRDAVAGSTWPSEVK